MPGATALPQRLDVPRAAPCFGTRIDFIDMAFNAESDSDVIDAIRGRDAEAPFAYVVTPNVDHVVRLQRTRSDLWPVYRSAWMTLCDSRILARLAGMNGLPLPVIPGSDLTVRLLETVIGRTDRIAVLGGASEDVEALCRRYRLDNVVHHNPPMGFIDDAAAVDAAVRFVRQSRPRYSFFALGSPQQEILAYRIARAGGTTGLGFCVGASLDFLTGVQRRAPRAVQKLSLEWLYRLGSDPRRMWRRYLVEGPEIFSIARDWRRDHALPHG